MKTFYGTTFCLGNAASAGEDVAALLDEIPHSTAAVYYDENVPDSWLQTSGLVSCASVLPVSGGEGAKSLSSVARFANSEHRWLDKDSVAVVAGGGATLDFLGLCCGLMYRGIRFISVPTSMMGMADAAYGGKTAVNVGGKNQIGMYHHPEIVYVNPTFLQTLPDVHRRSGLVEIAKLAVFFDDLRTALDEVVPKRPHSPEALGALAVLAATRKLELLEDDPFEQGDASVLVYGHPFANAFETFVREQHGRDIPHGLAVAVGIAFSAWLAERSGGAALPYDAQIGLVATCFQPWSFIEEVTPPADALAELLSRDKYVVADAINLPAVGDTSGYTRLPLRAVSEEYGAWRATMIERAHDQSGDADTEHVASCPEATREFYIAGRPDDETVAPLTFASARGQFLITDDHREILDWSAALNAPFGHSERVPTVGLPVNAGNYSTEQREALVAELERVLPWAGGVQFRSSGTESVEGALRYVDAALTEAVHTVSVERCYHGLTLGAQQLMASGSSSHHTTLAFDLLQDPVRLRQTLAERLGVMPIAIWLESVQGTTLRRPPSIAMEVIAELRAEASGRVVIICDDMLASIRCGDWCALEGLVPDILVGGKSWSSGYPFSFFAVAPWLREAAGDLLGTTTYGGNPIACAHAVHTIRRIRRDGILQRVQELERRFGATSLPPVESRTGIVRREWHGALFGFDMISAQSAALVAGQAERRNLLVTRLGSLIRCTPPLTIDDELVERGLVALAESVEAAALR